MRALVGICSGGEDLPGIGPGTELFETNLGACERAGVKVAPAHSPLSSWCNGYFWPMTNVSCYGFGADNLQVELIIPSKSAASVS
jgi:hypothetical protein